MRHSNHWTSPAKLRHLRARKAVGPPQHKMITIKPLVELNN
jgi:hypothetical protein